MLIQRSTLVVLFTLLCTHSLQARSNMLWSEKKRSAPLVTSTPDFAKLAEKLVPAVVYIEVTQKPKRRAMRPSPAPRGQDPFEFFPHNKQNL